MESNLITRIRSALETVNLLLDTMPSSIEDPRSNILAIKKLLLGPFNEETFRSLSRCWFELLRFRLRKLKMFALSGLNLMNHAYLESFLIKIEDAVPRNDVSKQTLKDLIDRIHEGDPLYYRIRMFHLDYDALENQIHKSYRTFFESYRGSGSLTKDEVLEIITSFLESLEQYPRLKESDRVFGTIEDLLESSKVHMTFLKDLILFATQSNVETINDHLLGLAEFVSICSASLLSADTKEVTTDDFLSLLEMIMPIDPQVYKTYTDVLNSSKGTCRTWARNLVPEGLIATKNLLRSLVAILWEASAVSNIVVVPMTGPLLELYGGLRLIMKMIFKLQQPNKFDLSKIKEDVLVVVCDAGNFIFSFYQKHVQLDNEILQNMLEAIRILLVEFGEEDSQVPRFDYQGTNHQLAFFDSVIQKLMHLTSNDVEPTAKSCAQSIQEELVSIRSSLGDILELCHNQVELQTLWNCVLRVAYRVEDFTNYIGDWPNYIPTSVDSILKDITSVKTMIKAIRIPDINLKKQEIKTNEVTQNQDQVQSTTTSMATEVVGFHSQANSIIDRLERGSQSLRVVAIVGMPGIGKTTLAGKVYKDPSVLRHFHVLAWTVMSQRVDIRKVFLDLFAQIDPETCSKKVTYNTTVDDLAQMLRRSLKQRRYLIVLDDIWDREAWWSLQESFPDDSNGSRILLTSRCKDVAPSRMLDGNPYELEPLSEDESLYLMQRNLFGGNGWSPESYDLQKQIFHISSGLPLTIMLLVGVLKSSNQEDWKNILNSLSSGEMSERCKDILELSYRHLPEHLKACLLYFASFEEDEHISAKRLTNLWTAEGFVQKVGSKPLSVVAEDYLNDLICRSLLMTTQKKSMGGVKTCRIHDLLYEFCLQKTKEEQFFHFVGVSCDEMLTLNEPRCMRRLCINSNGKCFLESKVCYARVHSLRFKYVDRHFYRRSISFLMHTSKLLRVLDLENVFMNWVIPGEIGFLVHLAYLAIGFSSSTIPPTSIGNLCNLQTFILQYYDQCDGFIRIPNTFWNLQTLKHFYVRRVGRLVAYGRLPLENLDSASVMFELDKISGLEIPLENMEEVMKKFPNIRRLRLTLRYGADLGGNHPNIAIPNFLKTLESLNMRTARPIPHCYNLYVVGMFSFPENLKKLTLTNFDLSESSVSSLGTLPNLEVLYLVNTGFEGDTWRMEEGGEFAKLRILGLDAPKLRRWTGSEDQFVCLEKLEVRCDCLKEMPSCLGYISTLQMIEVKHCPSSVGKLVKDIEKVQKDYGNSDLKIIMKEEYTW